MCNRTSLSYVKNIGMNTYMSSTSTIYLYIFKMLLLKLYMLYQHNKLTYIISINLIIWKIVLKYD